jgi:hypothetical protein
MRPLLLSLPLLLLAACTAAPRSPQQARLDGCMNQADRNVITSASLEPGNRVSIRYRDGGSQQQETERFFACMQNRAPAYPTVR